MNLPPRIVYYGDRYKAESYLPVALKHLAALKSRMEAGKYWQLSKSVTLDDGTRVRIRSLYGLDQVEIFAEPEEVFVEEATAEEDEVGPITPEYTFYVDTDQGRFWIRLSEIENQETHIVEKVVEKTECDVEDESYENRGMDTGHCRKSFEIYGRRYLLTSDGQAYDDRDGVVASYPGSDVQFLVDGDQFVFFLPSAHAVIGQLFSFHQKGDGSFEVLAGQTLAMSERYIPTDSLKPIPHSVHMKCSGSYFEPQKTIGYEMDTGIETPPWDETGENRLPNVSGLANQVNNSPGAFFGGPFSGSGVGDGEYYFNMILDLIRLAGAVNGVTSFTPGSVKGVVLTETRDYWFPGPLQLPWGGWGHSEFGGIGFDVEEQWLAPRLMQFSHAPGSTTATGQEVFSVEIPVMGEEGFLPGPQLRSLVLHETECATSDPGTKKQTPPLLTGPVDMTLETDCIYTAEVPGCGLPPSTLEKESKTEFYSCDKSFSKEYLTTKRSISLVTPLPAGVKEGDVETYGFEFLAGFNKQTGELYGKTAETACGICGPSCMGPGEVAVFSVGGGQCSQETAGLSTNLYVVEGLHYNSLAGRLQCTVRMPDEVTSSEEFFVRISCYDPAHGGELNCEQTVICCGCCFCDAVETLRLSADSPTWLAPSDTKKIKILGGCPPFTWEFEEGLHFLNSGATRTEGNIRSAIVCGDEEGGLLTITDNCGNSVYVFGQDEPDEEVPDCTITGPDLLSPGEYGVFYYNAGDDVVYTGSLELLSMTDSSLLLMMPNDGCGSYTASVWSTECETVSTAVGAVGWKNYVGTITYSPTVSGVYHCLTDDRIREGYVVYENRSYWNPWPATYPNKSSAWLESKWTTSKGRITWAGPTTICSHIIDSPANDNRGSVDFDVYAGWCVD